jgi:hypothetical protein
LLFVVIFGLIVNQDHQSAQFPGSELVSSHSNYKGLPSHFRWDTSYRTDESFPAVYEWYSVRYRTGAEARALGGCILLEGTSGWLLLERFISVILCDMGTGRMIYVTRSTAFQNPF